MIHGKPQIARFFIVFLLVISGSFLLHAQNGTQDKDTSTDVKSRNSDDQTKSTSDKKNNAAADADQQGGQDPLSRPKPQTPSGKKEKLNSVYKKWLDEDVRWIITSEEESAFKKLSNDAERDTFIEGFWLRRDPTPDTRRE